MVLGARVAHIGRVYRVIWYKDAAEQVATVNPALSDAILDWETYPDFFTVLSLSR